jgi:hypothetical protein
MSKRIVIYDSNYISLFGRCGPLTSPITCEDSTVLQLINAGHKVYEKLPDGSTKRLTRTDFEVVTADKIKATAKKTEEKVDAPVEEEKPVVNTEAKVEATKLDEGKVFNGLSATTEAVIPEKKEEVEEANSVATSKAQRRAQKKAKLEAAKEAENASEE